MMPFTGQSVTDRLVVVPLSLRDAADYVRRHHRHSPPPRGMKFALGASRGEELLGIAVVGRPLARLLDDGWTVEALRVCTTGEANICSFLYRACWRAARALGYRRLVTYTLASESGASLRGAGMKIVGEVRPQTWHRAGRPRDHHDPQQRLRWELSDVA